MYQKHFGLKTKPFGSIAEGAAVFVGPQQTKVINSLKKGLNAVDSIVAVSGPVGVGKTTIVSRALESLSPGRMVALVGRMKLAPDEVLELLLTGFGISRQATGTIQRFAAFRRLLTERAAAGAQVAIVVEDAQRAGLDALVELESLTAADSGDATGANIILMGQLGLSEWLATPALARLRQRTRLRQVVEPFTAAEVLGYLRHSIRAAGGDFESMFDGGAVDMLYRCSEGIPRVINNLCESALSMAADEDAGPLTAEFIQKVARDALGIEVLLPHKPAPPIPPVIATEPEPVAQPKPAPKIPQPLQEAQPSAKAPEQTPEPAVSAQPDIESTRTQKKPEWTDDQATIAGVNNEEMPQELTFEVEQTARMQVINADKIIQAEKVGKKSGEAPEPMFKAAPMITVDRNSQVGVLPKSPAQPETKPPLANGPNDEDLPMLSKSMRIEAPTPAPPEALLAEARPKPKPLPEAKPVPKPAAEAKPEPKPALKPVAEAKPEPKPKTPEEAKQKLKAPVAAKPEAKPKPKPEPKPEEAKQKLKAPAAAKPEAKPKPKPEPKPEAKPKAKAKPGEKPRMPDIGVLEAAIEAAHKDAANEAGPEPANDKGPAASDVTLSDIPALSLELEATRNGPAGEPASSPEAAPATKAGGDKGADGTEATLAGVPALTLDKTLDEKRAKAAALDPKVAQKMGDAESITDLTTTMAETLFGDAEFEAISAAVVADPRPGITAPGQPKEEASPVMLELEEPESQEMPDTGNESKSAMPGKPKSPAAGAKDQNQNGNFDMTMSRRFDMVKVLNSGAKSKPAAKPRQDVKLEKLELADDKPTPKPNGSQPESIEQQMQTAITVTVKAISGGDVPPPEGDESEDKKSGGLFSRFKRSS